MTLKKNQCNVKEMSLVDLMHSFFVAETMVRPPLQTMYLYFITMTFAGSKYPNSILFTFENKIVADAGLAYKDRLCTGVVL